jgi:hypothetical protein
MVLRRIFGPKRNGVTERRKICVMRSKKPVLFTKAYYGDKLKEDGMGEACSTQARGEKFVQN